MAEAVKEQELQTLEDVAKTAAVHDKKWADKRKALKSMLPVERMAYQESLGDLRLKEGDPAKDKVFPRIDVEAALDSLHKQEGCPIPVPRFALFSTNSTSPCRLIAKKERKKEPTRESTLSTQTMWTAAYRVMYARLAGVLQFWSHVFPTLLMAVGGLSLWGVVTSATGVLTNGTHGTIVLGGFLSGAAIIIGAAWNLLSWLDGGTFEGTATLETRCDGG